MFFFSRDTQKCPWHVFSEDLSRALLAFHGHFFVNCHGHFLVYFSHESGNPFIKKKVPVTNFKSPIFEKCHGQFTAFTGTFSKSFTGNQKLSRGKKQTLISYSLPDFKQIWSNFLIPRHVKYKVHFQSKGYGLLTFETTTS